jgi:hypothetical protein
MRGIMIIFILTLECGHLKRTGPWDEMTNPDTRQIRHKIGDITWCDVCPAVWIGSARRQELAVREVCGVDLHRASEYREPSPELKRSRQGQREARQLWDQILHETQRG